MGLDRSIPFCGIAVVADERSAHRKAAALGGPVGVYRPVTPHLVGSLE
jgi:hypothetical protein